LGRLSGLGLRLLGRRLLLAPLLLLLLLRNGLRRRNDRNQGGCRARGEHLESRPRVSGHDPIGHELFLFPAAPAIGLVRTPRACLGANKGRSVTRNVSLIAEFTAPIKPDGDGRAAAQLRLREL
jgi:hypothetical protein